MGKLLFHIIPFCFILSCTNRVDKNQNVTEPPLGKRPLTALKLDSSYSKNVVTQKDVDPIIMDNDDTLVTAKVLPLKGKMVDQDQFILPRQIKLDDPVIVNSNTFHYSVAKLPDVIPIHLDTLLAFQYLQSETNEKLLDGHFRLEPKKGIGQTIICRHSMPQVAQPPGYKDAVINDIQYFDVDQGMNSSYVYSLMIDHDENLWFGTAGGLSRFNGETFTHYTEMSGLKHNRIWSILEDRHENIWFGTAGGGVTKFDGSKFIHFGEKQGFLDDVVRNIIEDKNGNIWFSTDNSGVVQFIPQRSSGKEGQEDGNQGYFIHFNETGTGSLPIKLRINCLYEDDHGDIWIGSKEGLFKLTFSEQQDLTSNNVDGYIISYQIDQTYLGGDVSSIMEDRFGYIWVGTRGGGLYRIARCKRQGFPDKQLKPGQLYAYNYTEDHGLPSDFIRAILEDETGNFWIGTSGEGLVKFVREFQEEQISARNPSTHNYFISITEEKGLPSNRIYAIANDRFNNLWMGTHGAGVIKYNQNSFIHLTKNEGLSNSKIMYIFEDSQSRYWLGSAFGGVTIMIPDEGEPDEPDDISIKEFEFLHYTFGNNRDFDRIFTLEEDNKGNIWIGTDGNGIYKLINQKIDQQEKTQYQLEFANALQFTTDAGISHNTVRIIMEDRSGNIWAGTSNKGLNKLTQLEDGTYAITHYDQAGGLSGNRVMDLVEDRRGNIWIGTDGFGVSMLTEDISGESIIHFTEKEGLASNRITSVFEDSQDNIWVSTDDGGISMLSFRDLSRSTDQKVKGGVVINYSTLEGLASNRVLGILEDRRGNIWASTEKGLSCLLFSGFSFQSTIGNRSKREYFNVPIINFTRESGLKAIDFNDNSALLDEDNNAWWGSGRSLVRLNLDNFRFSGIIPEVKLNHLEINGRFIDFHNYNEKNNRIVFEGVVPFSNYPSNLSLSSKNNHLTFHFSAIDWSAQHKIRYSHKIEGLSEGWSLPSSETKADYRTLPDGTHIFKVRALGESQLWSDPIEYEFTIRPPWWKLPVARIGYIFLLGVIIYQYVRWRTRQLTGRQKELEETVSRATSTIRKEKEKSDNLLLNILPEETASELKVKGYSDTRYFNDASVMFVDFKDFTKISEVLTPGELVNNLNECFSAFDDIVKEYNIEKIKTIGDSYMAVSGVPSPRTNHAKLLVEAGFSIQDYLARRNQSRQRLGEPVFEARIGIHSGSVIAGIVGKMKFQFDVWGDTVNIASRLEGAGEVNKLNISEATFFHLRSDPDYVFEPRGKVDIKGKGNLEMYFVQKKKNQDQIFSS